MGVVPIVVPAGAGEVRLTGHQVRTAVLLYLREIHGVPLARVVDVTWPVFDHAGDPSVAVRLGEPCPNPTT